MTVVLTNDDGIDAPGLAALAQAVDGTKTIVAPAKQQSGCSHQVTMKRPIHVQQRSEREFAVEGTTADCVRLGLSHLCPGASCVLAGINSGGNLGADIYGSGTLAAVREAALHGLSAIAISHYRRPGQEIDWGLASHWTAKILADLERHTIQPGNFWNVNLPHLDPGSPDPEIVFCPLSYHPLPNHYRVEGEFFHYSGEYGSRDRTPGSDVDICFSGRIAITLLQL